MLIKSAVLASLLSLVTLVPVASHAETLNFQSVGGESVGGEFVYPYNFSLDGSTTLTSMACLDFNREITFGETWNVTAGSLSMGTSQTDIDYRADAYLMSQMGSSANADLQYAIWSIFDPAATSNAGYTANSAALAANALTIAASPNANAAFYSQFTLYAPTANQTGWTAGIPQEFLAFSAAVPAATPISATPEPSSLALLGTGTASVLAFFRRRKQNA